MLWDAQASKMSNSSLLSWKPSYELCPIPLGRFMQVMGHLFTCSFQVKQVGSGSCNENKGSGYLEKQPQNCLTRVLSLIKRRRGDYLRRESAKRKHYGM